MPIEMFVKKNSIIHIDVYVYEVNGNVEATHEKSEIPKDTETEIVGFDFRQANYADSNKVLKQLQVKQDMIDYGALQSVVLHSLLSDWTFTDESGKKIKVTEQTVNSLQPAVARAAAVAYLSKVNL